MKRNRPNNPLKLLAALDELDAQITRAYDRGQISKFKAMALHRNVNGKRNQINHALSNTH